MGSARESPCQGLGSRLVTVIGVLGSFRGDEQPGKGKQCLAEDGARDVERVLKLE